ncbi:hypothetical protein PIB30_056696 [Stylosanthes scabra]|uniref:Uncharacterized protein n=1 Tax=Stylosanthes scabra TaxID=79078 RepID=A0ABU6SJT9_9FABA|nr:hypothetical protein [Stylosanthes scabra]
MGGTELTSMPLTLRPCQQWETLNETDSIRCKGERPESSTRYFQTWLHLCDTLFLKLNLARFHDIGPEISATKLHFSGPASGPSSPLHTSDSTHSTPLSRTNSPRLHTPHSFTLHFTTNAHHPHPTIAAAAAFITLPSLHRHYNPLSLVVDSPSSLLSAHRHFVVTTHVAHRRWLAARQVTVTARHLLVAVSVPSSPLGYLRRR